MDTEITRQHNLQLTLLLLYLNSWEEKGIEEPERRAWKGYDFETLDELQEKAYIVKSKTAKSVYLTEDGIKKAKELLPLLKNFPR